MTKQIKKVTVFEFIHLLLLLYTLVIVFIIIPRESDVVESKSVMEEQKQICNIEVSEFSDTLIMTTCTYHEAVQSTGWTTTRVNVRQEPNTNSVILATFNFNTQIEYIDYNVNWVQIKYEDKVGYIFKEYISDTECEYQDYAIPAYKGFKSYMGYKAITCKSSKQYKLQAEYAYTGKYGIRQVNGRYCVALGSYFNTTIGQYFDLILENGTVIPCIMGDEKDDRHTDGNNLFTRANKCCSEFVVDTSSISSLVKTTGDVSDVCEDWNSPVATIRVYMTNILDEE